MAGELLYNTIHAVFRIQLLHTPDPLTVSIRVDHSGMRIRGASALACHSMRSWGVHSRLLPKADDLRQAIDVIVGRLPSVADTPAMQHPVNALVYYRVVIYSGIVSTVRLWLTSIVPRATFRIRFHAARRILYAVVLSSKKILPSTSPPSQCKHIARLAQLARYPPSRTGSHFGARKDTILSVFLLRWLPAALW
jgi:hypothetical protein